MQSNKHQAILKLAGILCMVTIIGVNAFSQQADSSQKKMLRYDFHQLWHETGEFFKAPASWTASDWIALGATGAVTYGLMQVDDQIRHEALRHPNAQNTVPVVLGDQWGGFFFIPVTSIGLVTQGWITHNEKNKKLGYEIAQAAALSELVSFTTKLLVGRARPFTEKGPDNYEPFVLFKVSQNSFPAGHTDAAFAISAVLSARAKSPIWKILAYTPATLTLASRVLGDDHWTSDVFIGAALGQAVGSWVVNLHDKKESRLNVTSLYPVSISIALK